VLAGRGAKGSLRARFPTDRKSYTTCYEYGDDSDLEDYDDEDDISDDEPASAPQVVTVAEEPRDKDVVVLEKSDARDGEHSDVLSVSDLDSLFSESSDTKAETETAPSGHVGKVFFIEDVAFVT
jgi:hypothetical protein